jgi:hypothetical protein
LRSPRHVDVNGPDHFQVGNSLTFGFDVYMAALENFLAIDHVPRVNSGHRHRKFERFVF